MSSIPFEAYLCAAMDHWESQGDFIPVDSFSDDPLSDGSQRELPPQLIDNVGPEAICIAKQQLAALKRSAIDEMAKRCLDLLREGYSTTEIAQLTGASISTVKRKRVRFQRHLHAFDGEA